ncbi:MAG: dephospho-CoA kinase [Thermoanaerobaculia bacterium]
MLVGITGIPGSGKSTLLLFFKNKGFPVFESDEVVRNLYRKRAVLRELKRNFPQFFSGGIFLKEDFSHYIFSSKKALSKLEKILHPLVLKELLKFKKKNKKNIAVAEVPLLFEKRLEKYFDFTICVSRNKREALKSFAKSKGISLKEAERRASFQFPLSLKKKKADYVIKNNGTLQDLKNQFFIFLKVLNMKMKKSL